jgi:hypothetical protein
MFEYFTNSPTLKLKEIEPYHDLKDEQKKDFLNYDVAVRNLGIVTKDQIIEIFRRINSTNYALNDMEINNAMYAGKFNAFCQHLADMEFFEKHTFFRPLQLRRMGDVKFVASIIITMIGGYFNRDDLLEEYLARYNDEFPNEKQLQGRFVKVLTSIEDMQFENNSRVWKQADFFTLSCELDYVAATQKKRIDLRRARENLQAFYHLVDHPGGVPVDLEEVARYINAAIQAANDRVNRVTRGQIVRKRIATLQ